MRLSLEAFLALGWSAKLLHQLAALAVDPAVGCLSAHHANGRITAQRWDTAPSTWPADTIGYWIKQTARSRTAVAVLLVLRDGLTPYAAAKRAGVSSQAVYQALKAHRSVAPADA